MHNKTTQNTLKTTEYNRRPFAIKEEHGFLVESSRDIKLLVCITLFSPSGIRIFFNEEKTFLVCRKILGGSHASDIDGTSRWQPRGGVRETR